MAEHIKAIDRLDDAHGRIKAAALGIAAMIENGTTDDACQTLAHLIADWADEAEAATRSLAQALKGGGQ